MKIHSRWLIPFALGLASLVVWSLLAFSRAPAESQQDLGKLDVVVVRAFFDDPAMVADLATWTEPWEVDRRKGFVVLAVNGEQLDWLEAAGFQVVIDPEQTELLNRVPSNLPGQTSGIPGYPCYRTVEETYATAAALVASNPQLAAWLDIGDSWEKSQSLGGYDLNVLRLTNAAVPGPKPKLFAMTAVHAREYTTAELATRFAERLVSNYGIDPDVTWLLDHHEIHLLLHSNPDGRKQAETGLSWRKNTNQNYCSPTSNQRGADLNRNFEFQWGCCAGSSSNQCSLTYRGPSPASEPEVQAIQNYVASEFSDLREDPLDASAPVTTTGIFLDIHSYSELVLWPWGFTGDPAPNGPALQTLGRKLAYFNDYYPEQAIGLYPTDGTTDDFAYGGLGLPAYTFELGTEFFQSCGVFENTILPDNLEALIYAAKAAREPYLAPAGPEVLDLSVSEAVVIPGSQVTVTALLDDSRYNQQNGTEPVQNISMAELRVDVPYWITTTGVLTYPLLPADGNFDSPAEDAQVVVDTTGWPQGRHMLYARAQDGSGNAGVVSAVFLYVLDPGVAPRFEGTIAAADSGQPLSGTVSAGGPFSALNDGSTGLYALTVVSGTYDLTAEPLSSDYAPARVEDLSIEDYEIVEQDFLLYPYCEVFGDDVEGANPGWLADSPWAITTEKAHSPTHAWTDSPGGDYLKNRDVSLTSPVFDLSGYDHARLDFWQICDTEAGYDFCQVEISNDGGSNWDTIATYDGSQSQWEPVSLNVSTLAGQPAARIRFRLVSDFSVQADGWYLDDVGLFAAGPGCIVPQAPTAAFSSTSPDALGSSTTFTNTSTGTNLNYLWDFGDGTGTSTSFSPSYLYAAAGTYTVTLSVTNTLGVDAAAGRVDILAPTMFLPLIPRSGIP